MLRIHPDQDKCCRMACYEAYSNEAVHRLRVFMATSVTPAIDRRTFVSSRHDPPTSAHHRDGCYYLEKPEVIDDSSTPMSLDPRPMTLTKVCKRFFMFATNSSNQLISKAAKTSGPGLVTMQRVRIAHKRVEAVRFLLYMSQFFNYNPDADTILVPYRKKW
jgi:hypothetical protein